MSENNQMMSVEGQLVGMPLAGPESFSQQQLEYLQGALNLGTWIDVADEAQYNTSAINQGKFEIKYNPVLNLVSVTCDVNVKAGALNFFIWSNRLKPVSYGFGLGSGSSLYVSQSNLNQPSSATSRWINGVWVWPVVGGNQ